MELAQRCATTQKHLQIDLLMPINKLVSILRESAFLNFCCKRPGVHNKDTLIAEWQTMSAEQRSAFKPKHSEQPEPVDVVWFFDFFYGCILSQFLTKISHRAFLPYKMSPIPRQKKSNRIFNTYRNLTW